MFGEGVDFEAGLQEGEDGAESCHIGSVGVSIYGGCQAPCVVVEEPEPEVSSTQGGAEGQEGVDGGQALEVGSDLSRLGLRSGFAQLRGWCGVAICGGVELLGDPCWG